MAVLFVKLPVHKVMLAIEEDEKFPEDCINLPDMSRRHSSPTKD
jgi:hypothetical protein